MTHIIAEQIGLTYRVRGSLPFLKPREKAPGPGGRITGGLHASVEAFSELSFTLKSGDRLGLVGRNGSGKTTLLKVLAGIMEPTSGRLEIAGRTDALFNINLGFRAHVSGRRNIKLRGLINGWSPEEIDAHTEEIIEFSELGDFIDLPFKTYSQGMAARLAFSIATHLQPEILLMDEWIGAGDAAFQKKAQARMDMMAKRAKIVVLSSHNPEIIKNNCNHILNLEDQSFE